MVKRVDGYVLRKLSGVPYIMTFGQAQANLCRGVRLNKTGEFLWNLLENDCSRNDLLSALRERYAAADGDEISSDLDSFLHGLASYGIIAYGNEDCPDGSLAEKHISIAGLNLCLRGPSAAFHRSFDSFLISKPERIDQTITLINGTPQSTINGEILLRNSELTVVENPDRYVLFFPSSPEIAEAHMSKDGRRVRFYYVSELNDDFRDDIFHAIRLAYLYLAMRRNISAIHSASIIYKGRAWLFSGMSGTGKSTHTNLWSKLLGVPVINGDLNLVSMENGAPRVCGIPWCGTSGIFDPKTYLLGGIILLKQSRENYVEDLSDDQKILLISQRLITPAWTEEMLDMNLKFAEKLLPHILVCRLHCNISGEAVYEAKKKIDGYMGSQPPAAS